MHKFLAAAVLAAAPAFAQAAECSAVEVTVRPFTYTVERASFAELSRINGGAPTFGVVVAKATARWDGCRIEMGYAPAKLYVATELERDACSHELVMTHELEHIRLYREALDTAAQEVVDSAPSIGIVKSLKAFYDRVQALHAQHDSHEEYARNKTECSGRVLALTGVRFR